VPWYPYGCAVCEVEVDPDTGVVEVVRHTTANPSVQQLYGRFEQALAV
jgi:carbon-monoxide dehydrogenase large subunit